MPSGEQQSWRRWWSPTLRVLLVIALAELFVVVWWMVPPLLYRHSGEGPDAANAQLKAITDTRTALMAGLLGVGALLTFWLNSRVYRITARTFELTEQGHITERYTKAIEQLGDEELAVRLGGIYALERLAKDSERDYPTVVEVLSAFVREGSKRQDTRRPEQGAAEGNNAAAPASPATTAAPTAAAARETRRTHRPRRAPCRSSATAEEPRISRTRQPGGHWA